MSVTIVAQNKEADFSPNICGWDVIGYAFAGVHLPVTVTPNFADPDILGEFGYPRAAEKLDQEDAVYAAKILRHFYINSPSYRFNWLHEMVVVKNKMFKCEDNDPRDLQNYIEEFAKFLEASGGYRCV